MPRITRVRSLSLAIAAALGVTATSVRAELSEAVSADPTTLEEITVTATRIPQPVGDVAATVTVIDRDEIERRVANSIKDLVRYEPNVSVRNQFGRFGLSGFNVRGLDGNRVLVLLDGVRIADGFSIGDFSNASRNSVDIDALERVEILRGPASSLYGSNALAGVVTLVTKDPRDFLPDDGDGARLRFRGGWASADLSTQLGFTAAAASDEWSFMGLATHRGGRAQANQGTVDSANATRTRPNPQDITGDSLLTRVVRDGESGRATRLTLDLNQSRAATNVLTAIREQRLGPTRILTDALTGDDAQSRRRIALDQTLGGLLPFIDDGRVNLYHQSTDTTQDSLELRRTIGPVGPALPAERTRRFEFEQDLAGVELVLRSDFVTGPVTHRLVYGFEWIETDTAQLRDGGQRNLLTGAVTTVVGPDAFPVRDFPLTTTRERALFVQNDIGFLDDRLTLVPGIRVDRYELTPKPDAIFIADNPGITPVPLSLTRTSPKLGAGLKLDEAWSVHANLARGFRAPPYNDANIGFTNLQFGYTAIPNPDLKPERSEGLELGVRASGDSGFVAFNAFFNRYEDFIESLASRGVDPATGLLVFQSRNLTDVSIYGAELRGALEFGAFDERLDGLSLNTALGWSRGEDQALDVPVDSVDPAKAVLGVRYAPALSPWSVEVVGTAVAPKRRTDDSFSPAFRTPGYATLDAFVRWQITPRWRADLALLNVTDRFYWQWSDVRGRAATDPVIDRFTSPGRSVAVNLVVEL